MPRKTIWTAAGMVLVMLSLAFASGENLMTDAVTRATNWNEYEGELGALSDGKHPENSADPEVFLWPIKGILIFEFEKPVEIARVRIYVGEESGGYILSAYLGGHTEQSGGREPEGTRIAKVENAEYKTNGWTVFEFPAGTAVDNLELSTIGESHFYEIEMLGPEPTSVEMRSWGRIKHLRAEG